MTREELNAAWSKHIAATVFVDATVIEEWRAVTLGLIADERECVDREAQARAIRNVVDICVGVGALHDLLFEFADRVERGEHEVPP